MPSNLKVRVFLTICSPRDARFWRLGCTSVSVLKPGTAARASIVLLVVIMVARAVFFGLCFS